jgi:hypothetical protein
MIRYRRRFPRSVLFAKAAQLQSQIEFWLGETAQDADQASREIVSQHLVDKLSSRQEYLEGAREAVTRARTLLYDCP